MTELKLITDKDFWDYLTAISAIAVPVITFGFGILILKFTKKVEQSQWRSQKIIEKRINEWDTIRNEINDIFCYCTRVGDWKSLSPLEVINKKRVSDRNMHLSQPYFSKEFFQAYQDFIEICFAINQKHGSDAKIKSPLLEHQKAYAESWDPAWDSLFYESVESKDELRNAYNKLQLKVADELETIYK